MQFGGTNVRTPHNLRRFRVPTTKCGRELLLVKSAALYRTRRKPAKHHSR
jgi:hypothetical protein